MNLFIHGLEGDIRLALEIGDSHKAVKADFVLANLPFNDGSSGETCS